MARMSIPAVGSDPTSINLTQILLRLHQQLIVPDEATEARLSSSMERHRLENSLAHANSLLLELEQDALSISNPNKKQETQAELFKKRELILRLEERLGEYNEVGTQADEDESEDGEDLLGDLTPSSSPSHASASSPVPPPAEPTPPLEPQPQPVSTEPDSTLRARNPTSNTHAQERDALLGASTGIESTAPIPTTTESLLTHNRTEQEALTDSMLSMAAALKASSVAFSTSLESEKDIVDAAASGMDRNKTGLEAASKRMGLLRSMAEGRGWLGRMMLYAWIAGLAVLAIMIVFVFPKLRF